MPKLKNSAGLGDLVRRDRGARHFNHRPIDDNPHLRAHFLHDPLGCLHGEFLQVIQLVLGSNQRNHYFRQNLDAIFLRLAGGFDDRLHLHLENFRIGDRQTVAAMAQHRIGFIEKLVQHGPPHLLKAFVFRLRASSCRSFSTVRQEFMERRIEQANRHRQAAHFLEDADEIFPLIRQQFRQGSLRASVVPARLAPRM